MSKTMREDHAPYILAFTETGEVLGKPDDQRAQSWQIVRNRMLWQNSYKTLGEAESDLSRDA